MTLNACFSYVLAALISAAAANTALAGGRIIALAGETNAQIAALDDLGVLWVMRTDARSFRDAKPIGQLPGGRSPIDLALFSAGGTDYAAVTGASRAGWKWPGILYLFDIARGGKPQAVALGQGTFTGVVYDPSRNRVLIAEARQLAVLEAAPIPSGSPKIRSLVGTITAMRTIGPVALDSVAQRLYCADPVEGTVYAVDLESGRYSLVAQRLGEVRALCLDPQRARLYVGDCARRRIWAIRLNPTVRVEPFAAGVNLREPDGLAMDAAGNLWIADAGSGEIHVLAPNGQLLRTLTR